MQELETNTLETFKPNVEVLELIRLLVEQNEMILEFNRELLSSLGSPIFIVKEGN